MRALVTGAAGFLGRVLVRQLAGRGISVRAFVRDGARRGGAREADGGARPGGAAGQAPAGPTPAGPSGDGFPAGVEVVRGDVTDPAALARAVPGCDLVFHLAGARRGADREGYMRVNAESTRLLLEACAQAGAARARFVLAGSLAASGPSRHPVREEEPFHPVEWYGESKAEAERITLSFRERIPVAVARPPRIVGPGDRENLLFFRLVHRGVLLRFLGPERPISWIDVEDCAAGMLALAERPEAAGEAFFLASPERTTTTGLQRVIAEALHARPREIPIPPAAMRTAAALADGLTKLTGRKLPLSRKLARQVLAPGWCCDPSKAQERLGFVAATPLRDSVERSARWYLEQGLL